MKQSFCFWYFVCLNCGIPSIDKWPAHITCLVFLESKHYKNWNVVTVVRYILPCGLSMEPSVEDVHFIKICPTVNFS